MSHEQREGWGRCLDCHWWQIEPEAPVAEDTVGQCIDEKVLPYKISITGAGGCTLYMGGTPARSAGSSQQPPSGKPAR